MVMIGAIGTILTAVIIYGIISLIKKSTTHPLEGKPVKKSQKISKVDGQKGVEMSRQSSNADLASQYDPNKEQNNQQVSYNIASEFK